jgi:hypothetical protein
LIFRRNLLFEPRSNTRTARICEACERDGRLADLASGSVDAWAAGAIFHIVARDMKQSRRRAWRSSIASSLRFWR